MKVRRSFVITVFVWIAKVDLLPSNTAGRQEAGTEVAAVCAHALLALEPLIHPRCLPPAGTPAAVAACMATGRATTSGALVSHLQRPNKPITAAGPLPTVTTNTGNGFGVVTSLKIGQLSVDPWAEVDTWLGYGEDFADDDSSLFYSENDGILVEDFGDGGLGGTPGFGRNEPDGNEDPGAPLTGQNGDKNGERPLNIRNQPLPQRDTIHLMHLDMDEGHAGALTLEKEVLLEGSYREQATIISSVSSPLNSSLKGEIFQDSPPALTENEGEGISTDLVDKLSAKPMAVEVGDLDLIDRDTVMCSGIESKTIPTSNFAVTDSTYSTAENTFTFPSTTVDIGSDSDSEGPLPDIIDGDPDPESDWLFHFMSNCLNIFGLYYPSDWAAESESEENIRRDSWRVQ